MISNGSIITNGLIDEPKRSENKGVTPFIPYSCYEKIDRSKLTGFEALNFRPVPVSPMLQWLNETWPIQTDHRKVEQ